MDWVYAGWMLQGALQKLVLVVTAVDTKETLERWTFDIQGDDQPAEGRCGTAPSRLHPLPFLCPPLRASKKEILGGRSRVVHISVLARVRFVDHQHQ